MNFQVEQLSALIGTTDYDENMERLFGEHFQEQVCLHNKSFTDKIKKVKRKLAIEKVIERPFIIHSVRKTNVSLNSFCGRDRPNPKKKRKEAAFPDPT